MKSVIFWTADKDLKENMIFTVEWITKAVKKAPEKKNSGLTGNPTLTFAVTGRNALSIEEIYDSFVYYNICIR